MFDPVQLEILWAELLSITEEMGITMKRTAYSEMVREANDFSCALFDSEGNLLAQTDLVGSPGHLGSIRDVVKLILKEVPAGEFKPGDSYVTNDPFIVAGHLPDIAVVSPIFVVERIAGFVATIAHHTDIGGKGAGGHIADARQIFEEGLRIPIMKFLDSGRINRDLARIIEANVRVPHKEMGDLVGQNSANHVAQKRLEQFFQEHHLTVETFTELARSILDSAERSAVHGLSKIPPGSYKADEFLEDVEEGRSIPLVVEIEVGPKRIKVDYTGTGAQSEYAINSVLNYTFAYTSHAVKCVVSPRDPMNEGFMRTIDMIAPEGTVVNPRFPAAVGARHLLNWRINSLIFRAMAPVIPDHVIAPSGGTGSCMPQFLGTDPRTGRTFVQIANHSGGLGGRPNKDGIHAYPFPARAENTPVEVLEHAAPLRVERLELIQDSGGAGKYRGGCGVRVQFRILTKERCVVGAVAGRDRFPAQGIFGGKEGSKSAIIINPGKRGVEINPRKITLVNPGDLIEFKLPGGGGYGDPRTRDPIMVKKDVESGIISLRSASKDYGVVFRRRSFEINEAATRGLRARVLRTKGKRRK